MSSAIVKCCVAMKKTNLSEVWSRLLVVTTTIIISGLQTHLASLAVEASPLFCLLYNVIELVVGDLHVVWNKERSLITVEAMVDI